MASNVPSLLPSRSPSSEPVLSPSAGFVVGGLNQGAYDNDSPENWTWVVVAVILLLALCLLVGLGILVRRRRNRSEQSESLDCFPDVDSASVASSPSPEPVDPFSFPEIKEQVCFDLLSLFLLRSCHCKLSLILIIPPFSARCTTLKKESTDILVNLVLNLQEEKVNIRWYQ